MPSQRDPVSTEFERLHASEVAELVEERKSIQEESNEFRAEGNDRYTFVVRERGVTFEADRLRREHHELRGELTVRCDMPGARSVNGCLTSAVLTCHRFGLVRTAQNCSVSVQIRRIWTGSGCWRSFASECSKPRDKDSPQSTSATCPGPILTTKSGWTAWSFHDGTPRQYSAMAVAPRALRGCTLPDILQSVA